MKVFGGCALVLLMGTGVVHAREEQADVIGCARDFSGSPVRGATVELKGTNYQGGDIGWTKTEWDGTFKLKMKKGTRANPADAKVTVWSTIAGQRSRDRGGIGEKSVRNVGEALVTISPCIVVNGPFFIGGVVSGKDPTPRVGSAVLRLKLTTQNPVEVEYLDVVSHGGYEFSPWFAGGTGYKVFIERQPDGERCDFVKPPPSGTTGMGDIIDRVRFVQAVNLECKPVALAPPAAEAPPDLGALPTRPGTELGNSLAMQGIADAERREREREAEERFLRLAAIPSRELDAECARRAAGLAAVQRKALYEIRCALASQARIQMAEADRQIAAQAVADAAAERERQRLAALEAERSARDARELAAAVGQLAGVLAQAGRQSSPPVRDQSLPAPRVVQAAPSQGYAAVVPNPYYPTLTCVQMSTQRLSNGQVIPCVRNNCGRSIESHTSAGMWTVGAGACYSGPSRAIVLYGACERNDSFDRSRNMCKR